MIAPLISTVFCFSASRVRRVRVHIRLMLLVVCAAATLSGAKAWSLSLSPEEFQASRKLACVLAQQSLGQLSDTEYGNSTHDVLDGFDQAERESILAKALGYYDGLMFSISESDADKVQHRLQSFVASSTCDFGYKAATLAL